MTSKRSRFARGSLSVAFAAVVSGAALLLIDWMELTVVDDAAISIAYGLSFWEGFGFRLTHNSGVVEGFTSPLWAVVAGFGAFAGADPLPFVKWTGSVFGVLGAVVLASSEAILERRGLGLADAWLLLLSLVFPSLFFWLPSGMETGLTLLVMALAYVLVESVQVRGEVLGLFFASLVLVRPELVITGAGLTAWWVLRRRSLRGLLGFGGGLLLLLVARRLYFSDWLPNTYFAKRTWDFNGATYLGSFVLTHVWSFAGALLSTLVVLLTPVRRRLPAVLVIILSALWFGFRSQGDWMREWRFLVWVLPFLLSPVLLGWSALQGEALAGRRRWLAGLVVLSATGLSAFGAFGQYARFSALRGAPEFPATYVMGKAQELKKSLDEVGALRPHLGLPDIGGLALVFRESDISDVAGLADYAMAHAPGTAAMEDYLLHEGPPLAIDAHGPSGHVSFKALKPWFGGWGKGLATMKGLTAEEDPRCPGQKAALLSGGAVREEAVLRELIEGEQPVKALRRWRCAETYLPEGARLSKQQSQALSLVAEAHAERLAGSDRELSLRYWSLATLLSGQPSPLRRRTERLRAELFPGEAAR